MLWIRANWGSPSVSQDMKTVMPGLYSHPLQITQATGTLDFSDAFNVCQECGLSWPYLKIGFQSSTRQDVVPLQHLMSEGHRSADVPESACYMTYSFKKAMFSFKPHCPVLYQRAQFLYGSCVM